MKSEKVQISNKNNNIILIPKKDDIFHSKGNRGASEEKISNIELFDNSNNSKEISSYNSLKANYNMNVTGFEDENKLYEENITRINSIKNKKVINMKPDIRMNFNLIKNNVQNELNQLSSNKDKSINTFIKIKLNLKQLNSEKFNISINFDKKYLNVDPSESMQKERSKSEIVKCNFKKEKTNLIDREKKRRELCTDLYNNIIDRNKKYFESISEIKKLIRSKKKNNLADDYHRLNNRNIKKINIGYKTSNSSINDDFSFRNIDINKSGNKNSLNNNKEIIKYNNYKNNTTIYQKYNNFNNNYNLNSKILQNIINTDNNINLDINHYLPNKKITDYNNRINIIINNNVNSFNKQSESEYIKTNNKEAYYIPNNKYNNEYSMKNSEINSNKIKINLSDKNYIEKDSRSLSYLNKIQKNNKNKKGLVLIQNIAQPISKNYFCRNQMNNTDITDNFNSINNDLNSNIINKKIDNENATYQRKIKLYEYKPLYNGTEKSQNIKNIDFGKKRINSFKNINSPFQNDTLFDLEKMKMIQLKQKNIMKISPKNMNYHKNVIINKRKVIRKSAKNNNNINNNNIKYDSRFSNDINSCYIQNRNIKLDNNFQLNNSKRINLNQNNNNIIRHHSPSPSAVNINNNLDNLSYNINKIRNKRCNSYKTIKQDLYNDFQNYDNFGNLNQNKGNINYLITRTNNYNFGPKCYYEKL